MSNYHSINNCVFCNFYHLGYFAMQFPFLKFTQQPPAALQFCVTCSLSTKYLLFTKIVFYYISINVIASNNKMYIILFEKSGRRKKYRLLKEGRMISRYVSVFPFHTIWQARCR